MKTAIISLLALLALINIPQVATVFGSLLLLGAIASLITVIITIVRSH